MVNQRIKEITLITIGSLLFAIGINYFAIPNRLSEGGIIGLTVVTYYLFDWSPGVVNFAINAVLLAVGYKFFDKENNGLYNFRDCRNILVFICYRTY